jgi:RNA polymerase sigma-70 factor (ECF subfamily)
MPSVQRFPKHFVISLRVVRTRCVIHETGNPTAARGVIRVEARLTDGQLMARVQDGDRLAFAEIVERHKDAMVNYLTRLTGCRARGEEMAQECFVRLYLSRGRYREEGKLGALLYRIATNLAYSDGRRRRRRQVLSLGLLPAAESDASTPESELLAREAQAQLLWAIRQVRLRFRVPLLLYAIEGLSYGEVAQVLGCAENTVKSRISRGRRQLKQHLDGQGGRESLVEPKREEVV